jgi:hypothetical protein
MNDDLPLFPLYRRAPARATRPNIDLVQWPGDVLELRWIRIR